MIYERWLEESDRRIINESLETDEYHKDTSTDFFYDKSAVCKVYEDENGPIMYVKGTKAIRLDIQFVSNNDFRRNRKALLDGFDRFVENAKAAGFSELIFCSNSPLLKDFCKKNFGFKESSGEMRKFI